MSVEGPKNEDKDKENNGKYFKKITERMGRIIVKN